MNDDKMVRCSFCGKTQNQVHKLIAGPNGAFICDECVDICTEIIEEDLMEKGLMPEYDEPEQEGKYVEIPDRKEAIAYAIHHGEPGDIVVLAGKGHEDYQEIKGKKYPMDERVLIADILAGK